MRTYPDNDDDSYTTAVERRDSTLNNNNESQRMEMGLSVTVSADSSGSSKFDEEALTLPQSTHCFLFTEPVLSLPFIFSLGIAGMSYTCLALALINNFTSGSIPTNVEVSVRIAQYLSIIIALLMEEEIPTGLYLLRRISQPYLHTKFPEIKYWKFVFSSILRITMGYLFLINVVVILMQATSVIEIFYDVLALQFVQTLDDISFRVSKWDVLGKQLQRATNTIYFHTEFQKQKESKRMRRRMKIFLKALYFINLAGFVSAMLVISVRQYTGYYQCDSITLTFGEEVWRDAIVRGPEGSSKYRNNVFDRLVLPYSTFNGVYKKEESRHSEGRPIYVEQKKYDRTPFDEVTPTYDPYSGIEHDIDRIVPAVIKYCGGRWVFSHEYIYSSAKKDKVEECPWLLRSPKSDGFDLLDVEGEWQIWTGVISDTSVDIKCNQCSDDADCNQNGSCQSDGNCKCDINKGAMYLGTHCEVKLRNECRTIIGEEYNETWSVEALSFSSEAEALIGGSSEMIAQEYSHPIYSYVDGLPEDKAPSEGNSYSLIFSGSRWFRINMEGSREAVASDFWIWQTTNYHAFWSRAYVPGVTDVVSAPTTGSTPVNVDFFYIRNHGHQFGPFGDLYPMQDQPGRGYYRCMIETCSFCPNGITIDEDFASEETCE